MNAAVRFWEKVDRSDPAGCWPWLGTKSTKGYGRFWDGGRTHQAHRWSYTSSGLVLHDGLELDHLCRNRTCVNPSHLEPVTGAENRRRGDGWAGVNARKTHCQNGHEYTPENTRPSKKTGRTCRICWNAFERLRYARQRLLSPEPAP